MDMVFSKGRVRLFNAGATLLIEKTAESELFRGHLNLVPAEQHTLNLSDCLPRMLDNLYAVLTTSGSPLCSLDDGIHALELALRIRDGV
ncbi:hypothetical protein, partial [Candidatus Magnetaquicoccus inordinatus]|uniref:hypothetical protein n=1 Tax=Candidatus Magnetaquicoccus inordinatus TaxID=2496818 RepID=UPI001D0DD533